MSSQLREGCPTEPAEVVLTVHPSPKWFVTTYYLGRTGPPAGTGGLSGEERLRRWRSSKPGTTDQRLWRFERVLGISSAVMGTAVTAAGVGTAFRAPGTPWGIYVSMPVWLPTLSGWLVAGATLVASRKGLDRDVLRRRLRTWGIVALVVGGGALTALMPAMLSLHSMTGDAAPIAILSIPAALLSSGVTAAALTLEFR